MTRSLQSAVMLTLLLCHTTLTTAQVRQHPDLPQGVSESWWHQVQTHIRQSEYHISKRHDGRYTSPNRAHNLRFVYEPHGFSATRRDSLAHLWHARLTFAGLSKHSTIPPSPDASAFTLTAEANTLVAQSDAIVIQYRNDEKGMRQDFIVKRKPDGNGDLRLWLDVEMQGGTVSVAAERISFLTEGGAEAMRYSELKVWDARQKRLKARFEKVGDAVAIVVSDRHAMYPITIDPLSTVPNWTAESNQVNAQFGFSVASAGDVNGDGFSDVIVGAYLFDNGETDEGRAYVYHGSASGLSTTPNWTAESNQANAVFGWSVASAGDVNGDGFSDVIVGARLFDNGETDEGRAFVYHGSAAGLGTTPNWTAESNQVNAQFGVSVASAGDVNGDGFSDVIVGAPLFDNPQTNEGRAFVYHGSASGLSTTPNWTAESNQVGAQFGRSVASAGDVNGDGFSDVIVGAHFFENGESGEGLAFVYHGSGTSFVTQTVNGDGLYTFPSTGVSIFFTGVSGSGTCKVVRYDNPASNRSFSGTPPTSVSPYRFVIKATGFTFSQAELRFNRTQIPNAGIGNASTVTVYRRPTPGSGAHPTPGSGRFVALSNAFNSSFPNEVRAITTAFSEFSLGSNSSDNPLPVELVSFRGTPTAQGVQLAWQTATELNNAGFEVRRKTAGADFVTIASYRFDPSLRGKGTTNTSTTYTFLDADVEVGKTYTYRLRSVDFDGTVHDYAQTVSVEVREPVQARVYEYALAQNYPNPFNPATTIRYSVKELGKVSLRVYDVMGREVMVLVDGVQGAGEYAVAVDGSKLSSGVYVYQLRAGGYVFIRKMMLVK